MENKICKECNIEKHVEEFKGNLCTICFKSYMKNYMNNKRKGIIKEKDINNKTCKKCNIHKNINEFKNTGNLCKICFNEYMKNRRPKKINKVCKQCNIEKNKNEFNGKLCFSCYEKNLNIIKIHKPKKSIEEIKQCQKEYNKKYRNIEKNKIKEKERYKLYREKLNKNKLPIVTITNKCCSTCNIDYPITEFLFYNKIKKYSTLCKTCIEKNKKFINPKNQGYIYIIIHPLFENFVKIGRTKNINDRLKQYQTYCPLKDYQMIYNKYVNNLNIIEKLFKTKYGTSYGEWYNINADTAIEMIELTFF